MLICSRARVNGKSFKQRELMKKEVYETFHVIVHMYKKIRERKEPIFAEH